MQNSAGQGRAGRAGWRVRCATKRHRNNAKQYRKQPTGLTAAAAVVHWRRLLPQVWNDAAGLLPPLLQPLTMRPWMGRSGRPLTGRRVAAAGWRGVVVLKRRQGTRAGARGCWSGSAGCRKPGPCRHGAETPLRLCRTRRLQCSLRGEEAASVYGLVRAGHISGHGGAGLASVA